MKRLILLTSILLALSQACWGKEHAEARNFVKEALLARLEGVSICEDTVSKLLAKDADGHPLSFIPDCPICLGVQDALLSLTPGQEDHGIPPELATTRASTRTSSLARMVQAAVKEHLNTIEDVSERLDMADKLRKGSEEGQRQLARYQVRKVEAYKMMWSCLMCDAAARAGDK